MLKHIGLYVNEYTLDLGENGQAALDELLKRSEVCQRRTICEI